MGSRRQFLPEKQKKCTMYRNLKVEGEPLSKFVHLKSQSSGPVAFYSTE